MIDSPERRGRPIALVSGGSRGIGRAAALRLAEDGFDIALCYRDREQDAKRVAEEVADRGGRAVATRVDVCDPDEVRAWVAATDRGLGAISVAVTSAGITRDGPAVAMSDQDWQAVLRTNLDGVHHVCRAAAFGMMKRRRGSIVNLASVSGLYGNAKQVNYSAAKAGIIGFSKALAKEIGSYGVRVNAVAPGFIETDMTGALPEAVRQRVRDCVALGRMGTAEEVANLVAFLASDQSSYITGSVLEIHGGISM